ncbi:hypothetical protein E2562_001511 [Oryza meyeriana var. granulata]|uniref:Uncharacterized protein n=1 Tax=Oryza meyeriana var. granulata TaxID=110450 RepID=A0A6G1DD46_9ORYZ|nr:hypothetical protein E2562_001511 [Oryza meyeriana var. granulata]
MDISTDYIDHFNPWFLEQTGHRCSAFEVLITKAWQLRTHAARIAAGSPVHVCLAMNARPVLRCTLLDGFYGICYSRMVHRRRCPCCRLPPSGRSNRGRSRESG